MLWTRRINKPPLFCLTSLSISLSLSVNLGLSLNVTPVEWGGSKINPNPGGGGGSAAPMTYVFSLGVWGDNGVMYVIHLGVVASLLSCLLAMPCHATPRDRRPRRPALITHPFLSPFSPCLFCSLFLAPRSLACCSFVFVVLFVYFYFCFYLAGHFEGRRRPDRPVAPRVHAHGRGVQRGGRGGDPVAHQAGTVCR